MMAVRIEWDQDGIDELHQLIGEFADKRAQAVIDAAVPPVDTGFLEASGYIYSERTNTFDRTWESGEYMSTKGRGTQRRERVSAPQPHGKDKTVIGWAAVHAWQIEDQQPFIYPALLRAAKD